MNVVDLDQAVARLAADISDHEVDEEQQRRKKRPDTTGREAIRNQPEFNEQLWQYLNRRVSDWRVIAGKAKEYAPLFSRIEKDFGVEGSDMLGVWGVESAFGDPVVQQHHMRPVIPSLATLAWAEPRRRDYWEMELINALTIIQRGCSTPEEWLARGPVRWATPRGCPRCGCISASTMTNDGKISPFGAPDDALASTARYFVERGKYRRGEQLNRSGIRFH